MKVGRKGAFAWRTPRGGRRVKTNEPLHSVSAGARCEPRAVGAWRAECPAQKVWKYDFTPLLVMTPTPFIPFGSEFGMKKLTDWQ